MSENSVIGGLWESELADVTGRKTVAWIVRRAGVLVLGLLGIGGSIANAEPLVEADMLEAEIVLIPAGTLPAGLVGEVQKYIEARHRLKASVFPEMPMDPAWVIPGTGQQNAETMAVSGSATTAGTRVKKPFTIVITGSDINDPEMGLRYLFFYAQATR